LSKKSRITIRGSTTGGRSAHRPSGHGRFVRRRSDRRLLDPNLLRVDLQIAGQHVDNGIHFEQPPRRCEHGLLLPFWRRAYAREADGDAPNRLTDDCGAHDVVEPAVALLVRAEDHNRRAGIGRPGLDELCPYLSLDLSPHLRRLAQACLTTTGCFFFTAGAPCFETASKLVHFRGMSKLVEDRLRVLHVAVIDDPFTDPPIFAARCRTTSAKPSAGFPTDTTTSADSRSAGKTRGELVSLYRAVAA
jgi:hypothetical protein